MRSRHTHSLRGETVPLNRITQVWFAGVHSNVGGGYPEDQLSFVPLNWIIDEAVQNGLVVDPQDRKEFAAAQSPYARLYDSRAGFAAYYRYSPRQTPIFKGLPLLSKIHWTVLLRMVHGTDAYAPVTLPHNFDVFLPNGVLRDFTSLAQSIHAGGTSGDRDLDSAIRALRTPARADIALVWDTIFWRRCVYALTVLLTILAVIFPWSAQLLLPKSLTTPDLVIGGPVAALVQAVNAAIPSYAAPWKESLSNHPLEFGALLLGIALTLLGSRSLDQRIHYRSRLAWHTLTASTLQSFQAWRTTSRNAFQRVVVVLIVILLVIAAVLYAWHSEYPDTAPDGRGIWPPQLRWRWCTQ